MKTHTMALWQLDAPLSSANLYVLIVHQQGLLDDFDSPSDRFYHGIGFGMSLF